MGRGVRIHRRVGIGRFARWMGSPIHDVRRDFRPRDYWPEREPVQNHGPWPRVPRHHPGRKKRPQWRRGGRSRPRHRVPHLRPRQPNLQRSVAGVVVFAFLPPTICPPTPRVPRFCVGTPIRRRFARLRRQRTGCRASRRRPQRVFLFRSPRRRFCRARTNDATVETARSAIHSPRLENRPRTAIFARKNKPTLETFSKCRG